MIDLIIGFGADVVVGWLPMALALRNVLQDN
jgi:hypothetical protein